METLLQIHFFNSVCLLCKHTRVTHIANVILEKGPPKTISLHLVLNYMSPRAHSHSINLVQGSIFRIKDEKRKKETPRKTEKKYEATISSNLNSHSPDGILEALKNKIKKLPSTWNKSKYQYFKTEIKKTK